jgi:hypothetical protein
MSDFLTRVELHDAKWPDEYISRLHSAMAREGFSRTITDEKGMFMNYLLPSIIKVPVKILNKYLKERKKLLHNRKKIRSYCWGLH